jgi:hypothetical protein
MRRVLQKIGAKQLLSVFARSGKQALLKNRRRVRRNPLVAGR